MTTILPITRVTQDPPLWSALPPVQPWGRQAVLKERRIELGCEGAASRQQKRGPSTLHWGPEHSLLSSSAVAGKVAVSISEREREQGESVWEVSDMGESCTSFHPYSECEPKGPASPFSPN